MDAKDLTFEHWLLVLASMGLAMLAGFTLLVLAGDGLRWYKERFDRARRFDGPCD